MKIIRTSGYSGHTAKRDIDVTASQLKNWHAGALIQDAMPNLTDEEREFIKTGLTATDWNNIFSVTNND